jgi:hypothetical protein
MSDGKITRIRSYHHLFDSFNSPTKMSDEIRLSCWVQGDVIDRVFAVNVNRTHTVVELRKAILQKKPSFQNISADELEPHKVAKLY